MSTKELKETIKNHEKLGLSKMDAEVLKLHLKIKGEMTARSIRMSLTSGLRGGIGMLKHMVVGLAASTPGGEGIRVLTVADCSQ